MRNKIENAAKIEQAKRCTYSFDCSGNKCFDCEWRVPSQAIREAAIESFKAGADFALKHQWHDLLDNPTDLPEKSVRVNVMLLDGRYTNSWYCEDDTWAFNLQPIAWMEVVKPTIVRKK